MIQFDDIDTLYHYTLLHKDIMNIMKEPDILFQN